MSRIHRIFRFVVLMAMLGASIVMVARPSYASAADNVYYVDNALDSTGGSVAGCKDSIATNKSCSLRQALTFATSDGGTSEIKFIIPADSSDADYGYDSATSLWTISPSTPLPALSDGDLTITGKGSFFKPQRIVIDGSNLSGLTAIGFQITSANNAIRQIAVVNFDQSGTNGVGIQISGAAAQNNVVEFSLLNGNSRAGILVDSGASNNTIGSVGEPNIITNNGSGIVLSGSNNTTIQGNFIGLGLGSNTFVAAGNTEYGIWLNDSDNNTIGGEGELRNMIAASGKSGVVVSAGSSNNTLFGNLIGFDDEGKAFGNTEHGVLILSASTNNLVTGSASTPTLIGNNQGWGVYVSGTGTISNTVEYAYIGIDDSGISAAANQLGGVYIGQDASQTNVGSVGSLTLIGGNGGPGVSIGDQSTAATGNTVVNTVIGISRDGVLALPNSGEGIVVGAGSQQTVIGGDDSTFGNIIASNNGPGILVNGASNTTIRSNTIGLRLNGSTGNWTTASANQGDGIAVTGGATQTVIGASPSDSSTTTGNIIAGNAGSGIRIDGTDTSDVSIVGNTIGATPITTTLSYVGNGEHGVIVADNASQVVISNTLLLANTQHGVFVTDTAQQVSVLNSRMSRNGGKAIELDPETSGAPGVSTNPNHDIDAPFDLTLSDTGVISGKVLTSGDAGCVSCIIQVFSSDETQLDGQPYVLHHANVVPNASGNFSAQLPSMPSQVLVSATDGNGNTSEFAMIERLLRVEIGPNYPQRSAIPGETLTFSHLVTNTGTVALSNLNVSVQSKLGWVSNVTPSSITNLGAGDSVPVTLTITLPTGSAPNVYAGLIEESAITVKSPTIITVTDTVTDTTLVLPKFLLDVSPESLQALAKRDQDVTFTHQLTNNGNITTTVNLEAATSLGWNTEITQPAGSVYVLKPGETINAVVKVRTPSLVVAPTIADVVLKITSPGQPDRTQDRVITDTITITTTTSAIMRDDESRFAAAGATVSIEHMVENLSNGPATFRLVLLSASQNSTVTFRSNTANIVLNPDNSFTLTIEPGKNLFSFFADVKVNPNAVRGTQETIVIGLADNDGTILSGVEVTDTIEITIGDEEPVDPDEYLLYLPYVQTADE